MRWSNVLFQCVALTTVVVHATPTPTVTDDTVLVPVDTESRHDSDTVDASASSWLGRFWSRPLDGIPTIGRRQGSNVAVANDNTATTTAVATSIPGTWRNNCVWNVDGVGTFTSRFHVPASGWASNNYFNSSIAHGRYFVKNASTEADGFPNSDPSRILVGTDGTLRLQNDGQTNTTNPGVISPGAMISTAWNDIKYGSVRTVAKGNINPGSVYGMYFTSLNPATRGETDIEIRTSYPKRAWFTNQQYLPDQENPQVQNQTTLPSGTSANTYHEYRIDWVHGRTTFYIDGKNVSTLTTYVPGSGGVWNWNAWSESGDPWPQGLNAVKNIMYIQSIDIYVNRTSVTGCGINPYS